MMKNCSDIRKLCDEQQIRMIDFKITDLDGRWRHVTIPIERFNDDMLRYGVGFDSSNYGYAPVEKSDMVFIPDLKNPVRDPFAFVPTLSMNGNVYVIGKENTPFDQYPRTVCQRAEEYMKKEGIADEMFIAPEFEFYLFDNVSYSIQPQKVSYTVDTREASWNSGIVNPGNKGYELQKSSGYHICAPMDINYGLRSKMCLYMKDWGIDVKYHHHEVGGSGQMEIEVELGDMAEMADNTQVIKYIVKNAAVENGMTATFMPKPIYKEAGSGLHIHMLLKKGNRPLFYDEDGYSNLSQTALFFIGGLLEHIASLCAFTNPSTNSYKRLVPGYEAPVTVGYATSNRSAVIRIPAYAKSPDAKRFELRNPDATANPYYAYAAVLMAGIDGIKRKIDPSARGWGPYDYNLYHVSDEEKSKIQSLPRSLDEALDALNADHGYLIAGKVFPERLIKLWLKQKRAESLEIAQIPHPAEFEKYYDL